jgi:hypothetical protein
MTVKSPEDLSGLISSLSGKIVLFPGGQPGLALFPPEAVLLAAVGNLLIAGGVSFRHLDGPDQVELGEAGIVLHP